MKTRKADDNVLEIPHPSQEQPKLQEIGGSRSDKWNTSLANYLSRALPTSSETFSAESQKAEQIAAILALTDCKPGDPVEAILLAQIISANATGLELSRRAWVRDQTFEARTKFLALADRSARTVGALAEALSRHRGKGQVVRVERVTINEGGQAIVGSVTHQGGNIARNEEQRLAKHLTDAPGAPMLGQVETQREAVPVASG